MNQPSVLSTAMKDLARAGIRRVWLDDDAWCSLLREACGGKVDGEATIVFHGPTGLLRVYPKCARSDAMNR